MMLKGRYAVVFQSIALVFICSMICLLCKNSCPPMPNVPVIHLTIIEHSKEYVGDEPFVPEGYNPYTRMPDRYTGYIADGQTAYATALTVMNEYSAEDWIIEETDKYEVSFEPRRDAWYVQWPLQMGPNADKSATISMTRFVLLRRSDGYVIVASGPLKRELQLQ